MICIIPARSGSRRIPGKNIKDFHGKPIIAYSIKTAIESSLFTKVLVSSDSDEIRLIGEKYGAFGISRDSAYAKDEVGTQEVARHVLERIRHSSYEDRDNFVCVLYATAPLITPEDLQTGFRVLIKSGLPYAVSSKGYTDIGGFYFGYAYAFLSGVPLIYDNISYVPVKDIDINTPEDWSRAEKMYEEKYGHEGSMVR